MPHYPGRYARHIIIDSCPPSEAYARNDFYSPIPNEAVTQAGQLYDDFANLDFRVWRALARLFVQRMIEERLIERTNAWPGVLQFASEAEEQERRRRRRLAQ